MNRDDEGNVDLAIACTLTPDELAARRQWLLPGLLAKADARETIAGGFRWRFAPQDDLLSTAAAVIDTERRCCRFLRFSLTVEPGGGPIWIEVTGPPGTQDFLAALFESAPSER